VITQNQPVRFEWRNFRRSFRTAKIGDVHTIQVEVDAKTWQDLDTMPKDADGEMVIWWETRGEGIGKEPKPSKEPSPYGLYWKAVRLSSIPNCVELHDWLGLESDLAEPPKPEDVWKAMRGKFNTESLSLVSPEAAIQAFEQANLPGVAAIARRLAA
jgi:hypothetical protein